MWNPFATSKKEYQLGIDIGTSSIKVVELLYEKNSIKLTNYAKFFTTANYMNSAPGAFNVLDAKIVNTIRQMFARARFFGKSTAISLPVFSSFSTIIELPAMSAEELEEAIQYEARKYIPVPIQEVQFDWAKINSLSTDDRFKILTVAVPNEIINKYNRLAGMIGVTLNTVELETFSMARALLGTSTDSVVVVDIGGRITNVSLIEGGMVVVHHNISMGGTTFTGVLSRGMSIDMARAEELKQNSGMRNNDNQVSDLLESTANKLISEIEQVIDNYVRDGGHKPNKIILTGGGSLMPSLTDYLSKKLNLQVEIGNPFGLLEVPYQLKDVLGTNAPEFSVAVGLALLK